MTADQILKLDQGECVFINPAYRGGGEASVPMRLKVKISAQENKTQARSEVLWHQSVRQLLSQRATHQRSLTNLDQENEIRREMAERLFPLPKGASDDEAMLLSDDDADITEDEFDEVFQ